MHIKIRYKGTAIGFLWSVLEPLFIFLLLYTVFTNIRIGRGEDFAIYLITGVIFLHLFTRGSMTGLVSLRGNRGILKVMNIQKEFFPVVNTASVALLMFFEFAAFLILIPFFGFPYNWTLILLPALLGLFLILILGVSYLLSIVYVYIKDTHPIWSVITYSLIFISPVFWYLKDASGILLDIYRINPVGQIIELGHQIVFGTPPSLNDWLYTSVFIFSILFVSFAVFKKLENKVTERI